MKCDEEVEVVLDRDSIDQLLSGEKVVYDVTLSNGMSLLIYLEPPDYDEDELTDNPEHNYALGQIEE